MNADKTPGPTERETGRPVEGVLRSRQIEILAQTPLFQALPKRHRTKVADLAELRRYADGADIVRAGEPGDSFTSCSKASRRWPLPTVTSND